MRTLYLYLSILCSIISFSGCSILRPVSITRNSPLDTYQYVYVTPTSGITSVEMDVYGNRDFVVGGSNSRTANPSDIISGYFMKKGFIILPVINQKDADKTIIVSYGETGRRFTILNNAIEITLQIISADTHSVICTCSSEGIGETDSDSIRKAIYRALQEIIP